MPTETLPAVRVLTLNLDSNPATLPQRLPAAAAAIAALNPDVVLLQEVRRIDESTTAADQVAELTGLPVVAWAQHDPHPRDGHLEGVAILSRLAAGEEHVLVLSDRGEYLKRACAVVLTAPSGRPLLAATAHLSWGGTDEAVRLQEAVMLDAWLGELSASVPGAVTVLTGDLNTMPGSATMRYLTGLDPIDGGGAFWVDAWAASGAGDHECTSCPDNLWTRETAKIVGIVHPEWNPHRRIDYVLLRGWAYGRPGYPMRTTVECATPAPGAEHLPSDHYAVMADLWDPAL